jgi:hypothetical protein
VGIEIEEKENGHREKGDTEWAIDIKKNENGHRARDRGQ